MKVSLPLRTDAPDYSFTVDLDGVQFGFLFRWNERAQSWFAALFTAEGEPLAQGARVRSGLPLFALLTDARRPAGVFLVEDTQGQARNPGSSDLGSRVLIYYVSPPDI